MTDGKLHNLMLTPEERVAKIYLPWELAPLQKQDLEEAVGYDRVGWYYDVGAGKTACSTVTALVWDCKVNYVIVPHIIIPQWERWLRAVKQTDIGLFRGPKRTVEDLKHKWVLMSHRNFTDSFADIRHVTPDDACIIVDEAQWLKNPGSVLFRHVKSLAVNRKLQLLTGTRTSKPEDSYAYCHLIPQLYRSFSQWKNLHVLEEDFFGNPKAYRDLDQVAANMRLQTFTRSKKEMFGHDLDPIFNVMPYEIDKAHEKLYVKLAEEQLLLLPNGGKIDATAANKLEHALQQIVCNWAKFSGTDKRSAIFDVIDQVIAETECLTVGRSKLIIWTHYVATSEAITAYLAEKYGAKAVASAYGTVNSAKGVKAFESDPDARFGVFQPSSCGVGAEFQFVCSEMLFVEIARTPMAARQAIGRVDRKGQVVRPTVRLAQAVRTVQVRMFNRLLLKDDLIAGIEQSEKTLRDSIFGL
jgi:hypothetical protein